jgi:hypothetical protein
MGVGGTYTTTVAEPNAPHAATTQCAAAIESPADYDAIARTSPFLTQLSLELPGDAAALMQENGWAAVCIQKAGGPGNPCI